MALNKIRIIVGLGNPGRSYERHRHNIGFMVVDELAEKNRAKWQLNNDKTFVCKTEIESEQAILVKPQTYMNLSGRAVGPVVRKQDYEAASRMIVIHDDLDIPVGQIRMKIGGGDGGHKGIRSISESLRFRDFVRVRLGIGRPPIGIPAEEFVLMSFTPEEEHYRRELIDKGCEAVSMIIRDGFEKAQMHLHSKNNTGQLTGPEL